MTHEIILKYFPDLTEEQKAQFLKMNELYQDWNLKINVVSRKDVDLLYERHVLHSLAIAKIIQFKPGTKVLDLGTGGGFPGIPLAVMFPKVEFFLVDSIAKKIKVVNEVIAGLDLTNIKAEQMRVEKVDDDFDFIVSRAVAPLKTLYNWSRDKFYKMYSHDLKNGYLLLKGGDLTEELAEVKRPKKVFNLSDYFEEEFFETKKIVYMQMIK
ncbi:MAG TPA: 16S rRNA (guanine(527)-N(7))-methyltransferase RsmG [Microscillaceae bacterium]|nr:16S rRNA (guanine(527)-N(7))-methyltransferase RsmG [Microscillaceae bacterium]